jgi:hypothetical protein
MSDFHDIVFSFCSRKDAKKICESFHYMKTYPQGGVLNIAMKDKKGVSVGICVLGYSSATDAKIKKIVTGLVRDQYIEMQRLWISDDYGHNSESWCLSKIIDILKEKYKLKIIVTHSGGCKNDCGIVYQASGWLYMGSEKCEDFYQVKSSGCYKNIIAAMRFGRIQVKGKTKQEIGEELFGVGEIIKAKRYFYVYPICKGMRRRLAKNKPPHPKDSDIFRRGQVWIKKNGEVAGASSSL